MYTCVSVRTSWEDSSCWSWRISSYPILCTFWSSAYTSVRTRAADMTRTGKRSCTRTPASTRRLVPLPVSSLSFAWDHFWRTCSGSTRWRIPRCSCCSAPSSANDRTIFYILTTRCSKRVQKQFYVSVRVPHFEYILGNRYSITAIKSALITLLYLPLYCTYYIIDNK